ncbi:tryptophan halogenase family protein [Glaciecola sp. KUL10]|uniref:tryptophan halogenase family protein n=1 Tax=Glaciecola sp. (strain KUL10) TaxID=2161813 RepID=UPI000D789CD6|nr:tryptophan halogenase family protein [Glaciecola sp. KUL10]GBL04354.1 tryptophan halogenase [Glaciecola sp. KUL10]
MNKKTKVVIAGGGTSGWLSAYSLIARLGAVLDITLIESDHIGTVGVGEATIPTMRNYHQLIGIDEQEFMRATQATFKLGIEFENWGQQQQSYMHSFGEIGQRSWMVEFHEFWMEAKANGFGGSLDDYCLELKAAKANKFATKLGNRSINYAYHLNATAYAQYLRGKSEALGVKRVEGKITHISNHANGNISCLYLDNGLQIDGDFFIDCTGFKSLLLGESLGVVFEDWGHYLAADSAFAVQTESVEDPKPFTVATAHSAGWQWRIPLQHRTGNGLVFSNQFLGDQAALDLLTQNLKGKMISEPRKLKFRTGRRQKAWYKNCVAIGLANGFIEPLESTSIHLVTTALVRLMKLFPISESTSFQAERFNQETNKELESIRDFIILHYHLTEREDSEFWRHYKNMQIPETLNHRMQIFKENAYAWPDEVGLFRVDSWVQVMMGQGIFPKQHHLGAKVIETKGLHQQLSSYKQMVEKAVAQLPTHVDFLKQYCDSHLQQMEKEQA